MAGKFVRKPHQQQSFIKNHLSNKSKIADIDTNDFVLSFKHIDKEQGTNFFDWESNSMLGTTMETLSGYCNRPLLEQCDGKKFTIYGDFPADSNFTHPKHVPDDANWARIHINGLHIVAGHVYKNVFYVVFLDHDHTFCKMKDK